MRALRWHGKHDIRCDNHVPDPSIEDPRDAIIKVSSCAICGSGVHTPSPSGTSGGSVGSSGGSGHSFFLFPLKNFHLSQRAKISSVLNFFAPLARNPPEFPARTFGPPKFPAVPRAKISSVTVSPIKKTMVCSHYKI